LTTILFFKTCFIHPRRRYRSYAVSSFGPLDGGILVTLSCLWLKGDGAGFIVSCWITTICLSYNDGVIFMWIFLCSWRVSSYHLSCFHLSFCDRMSEHGTLVHAIGSICWLKKRFMTLSFA